MHLFVVYLGRAAGHIADKYFGKTRGAEFVATAIQLLPLHATLSQLLVR
jgi:hypothetical protein